MPLSPARVIGAACVSLLLLAAAADQRVAVAAPAAERLARERFQKAEMSFNLGKFSEALADYQAAYEAKPLPALLFNVAQCYRNLQNPERARFFYRRYLALDPRTPNRRLVEDLIAEMSRNLENQAAATPTPLPTAPPVAASVAVAPSPAPPALDLTRAGEASEPTDRARPVYKRWWFWTGVGAVVAGALLVGILATRADTPQSSLGTIDGR